MKTRYRVKTDSINGYTVQILKGWFPFVWLNVMTTEDTHMSSYRVIASFTSLSLAKKFIEEHRILHKNTKPGVVVYEDDWY